MIPFSKTPLAVRVGNLIAEPDSDLMGMMRSRGLTPTGRIMRTNEDVWRSCITRAHKSTQEACEDLAAQLRAIQPEVELLRAEAKTLQYAMWYSQAPFKFPTITIALDLDCDW